MIKEHNRIFRVGVGYGKTCQAGLVLEGEAAKEFWKNEETIAFTPRQLAMFKFKEAKRINRASRCRF